MNEVFDDPEHTHCLRPVGGLDEQRHDQRQRHRGDDRAPESLNRACRDEHSLRRRKPAGQRCDGEQQNAGDE